MTDGVFDFIAGGSEISDVDFDLAEEGGGGGGYWWWVGYGKSSE